MSDPIEVTEDREAVVGAVTVRRALPRRARRTVGAWCFADHFGPMNVERGRGIDIAPHPHMGLHTVTWLVAGEIVHRDSLGSEQVIAPGQLNLMTAGRGIAQPSTQGDDMKGRGATAGHSHSNPVSMGKHGQEPGNGKASLFPIGRR